MFEVQGARVRVQVLSRLWAQVLSTVWATFLACTSAGVAPRQGVLPEPAQVVAAQAPLAPFDEHTCSHTVPCAGRHAVRADPHPPGTRRHCRVIAPDVKRTQHAAPGAKLEGWGFRV